MRYHYMDAMRAAMMVAGVFYHASLVYAPGLTWRFRDPSEVTLLSWLATFLHSFRMPAFFIVAGFFLAFVMSRDGSTRKLFERLAVFMVPIFAMMFTLQPLQYMLKLEAQGTFDGFGGTFWRDYFSQGEYISHLWFLFNLSCYYVAGWLLLSRPVVERWLSTLRAVQLFSSKTALALAACTAYLPAFAATRGISFSTSYGAEHIFLYTPFFLAGFAIYRSRALFDAFRSVRVTDLLVLAVLLLIELRDIGGPAGRVLGFLAYYQCAFVLSAACLHLFYRYANSANVFSRTISDAAYTIYLFHHVLVVAVAMALAQLLPEAHALVKYGIVVLTALVLTLSVHVLVIARLPLARLLFNGRLPAPLQWGTVRGRSRAG